VCGVAAVIGAPDPDTAVARMIAAMPHRGPDGAGIHVFGSGALGMCRLRVRRPDHLVLPPASAGVRVAYNGEVYGTLPANASTVEGVGDELALLLGGSLERVDGMWALARLHASGLLLTRDRWGIRPLYYRPVPNGWAVASEIPALIEAFGSASVSLDAVVEMLAFGAPLSADTVYQEIHAVPPGATVELTAGRNRVVRPWTTGDEAVGCGTSRGSRLEWLAGALTVSVQRNLAAERPIGLALSGGLDSTLLADTLLRLDRRELVTVSVLVDDAGGEGVRSAVQLLGPAAAALGWRHLTTSVGTDRYLGLLDEAVRAMGYPTRMSSVPLYLALAEVAARAGVVVLLTGEGADELFLGYQSYTRYVDHPEVAALDRLERLHFPESRRVYLARLVGERQVRRCRELYRETAQGALDTSGGALRTLERSLSLRPLLERADVCLMSYGVEGRSPFLHGDVPAVAASFAEADLVSDGIGKRPLRSLTESRRGNSAGSTAKRPFRAPIGMWLCRPDAQWTSTVRRRVRSACRKLDFAETMVDPIVDDAHLDGEAAGLVGALLAVDAWEAVT
jgi:asparagine synthase (glutamine-hydrolysing)